MDSTKKALIIGIDQYDDPLLDNLGGCTQDAESVCAPLSHHFDNSPNYHCRIHHSSHPAYSERLSRAGVLASMNELFDSDGDILFYFSGHGALDNQSGSIVTKDGNESQFGIQMDEIIDAANGSLARSVVVILDCCFAGSIGNTPSDQMEFYPSANLHEGLTVLAGSRPSETSEELVGGQGVFTELLVGALNGGAANVRGMVSAAAIYGYVEAVLGPWDQRPMYKSHTKKSDVIRRCEPIVEDSLLRELPDLFDFAVSRNQMDPTFENSNAHVAKHENVEIFSKYKQLQIGGLLKNNSGRDLYWTAEQSGEVYLTPMGEFYWRLAKANMF